MAIYDPTQQINQLGQNLVQGVQQAGNQFVGQRQEKIDHTQRMLDNISAIRDEAAIMHQDIMQEEIDTTLSDLSSEIFKQRKNGDTEIDFSGFAGLNRKIGKLKNLASNSQKAAQMYDQTLKMAMADKYVMNKPEVFKAMTNVISDKTMLEGNPGDLENALSTAYTGSIDKVALIGDQVMKHYGTKQYSNNRTAEDGTIYTTSGEYVNQVMNADGSISNDGEELIIREAAGAGYQISRDEAAQVFNRLSSKRSVVSDFGKAKKAEDAAAFDRWYKAQSLKQKAGENGYVDSNIPKTMVDFFKNRNNMDVDSGVKSRNYEKARATMQESGVSIDVISGDDLLGIKGQGKAYDAGEYEEKYGRIMNDMEAVDVGRIKEGQDYIIINGNLTALSDTDYGTVENALDAALVKALTKEKYNQINYLFDKQFEAEEAPTQEKTGSKEEAVREKIVWWDE